MNAAGVPDGIGFATKLARAERILARRIESGQVPTALAGDAVYGRSEPLRRTAESEQIAYVLEVGKDHQARTDPAIEAMRVEHLASGGRC